MNMKTDSILKAIKNGKLENAYLLFGENEFTINEVIKTIKKRVFKSGFASFDQENFDVSDIGFNFDELKRALHTPPMASLRRLVILRNVHKLEKVGQDKLLNYLSSSISTSLLAMVAVSSKKIKLAFFEKIKKFCCSLNLRNLRADSLNRWIVDYANKMGYTIEPDAVSVIIEFGGNNQMSLSGEIEKMITYAGEKKSLRREDAIAILTSNKVKTVFDLQEAVGRRELTDSLSILCYLLEWGVAPAKILAILRQFFLRLSGMLYYQKKDLLNRDVARKLGVMYFNFGKEINFLKNFSKIELKKRLEFLYDAEVSSKSGGNLDNILTNLVYNLT